MSNVTCPDCGCMREVRGSKILPCPTCEAREKVGMIMPKKSESVGDIKGKLCDIISNGHKCDCSGDDDYGCVAVAEVSEYIKTLLQSERERAVKEEREKGLVLAKEVEKGDNEQDIISSEQSWDKETNTTHARVHYKGRIGKIIVKRYEE